MDVIAISGGKKSVPHCQIVRILLVGLVGIPFHFGFDMISMIAKSFLCTLNGFKIRVVKREENSFMPNCIEWEAMIHYNVIPG